MKKVIMAVVLAVVCSGLGFAESMAGKLGLGLRNDAFDARYFLSNSFGIHAGTALASIKPKTGAKSSEFDFTFGGFYSKEITDGLMFQAGMTIQSMSGKAAGVKFQDWAYNPYLGAEFIYKGRFGFDFKVIPIQYATDTQAGATTKVWSGGSGSIGAHIYFK